MSRTADRVRRLFRGLTTAGRQGMQYESAASQMDSSAAQVAGGLEIGCASHTGNRSSNEDYAAFSGTSDFFAVSDGIGGAPYGDVMSRLACNAAIRAFDEGADIQEAFEVANEFVSLASELLGEHSGATLLLAARHGSKLTFASVGDSRAFLLRNGLLVALTEAGRANANSNALDKAVGYGHMEPDMAEVRLLAGDRLLLCTDGVWEYVASERLSEMLGSPKSAPIVADDIAWEASRVGQDNCTCVCAFVSQDFCVDDTNEWAGEDVSFYGSDTPTADFSPE